MAQTKAPNLDLQRERFKQQMTRTMLSQRTGISRKSLIDIEMRRSRVRLENASRIAKAFPVPVEVTDIFTFEEVIG